MNTNKEFFEDVKPEEPKKIGTVNNELEHMTELGAVPVHKEIGLMNDEASPATKPLVQEIGRFNHFQYETPKLPDPEIGVMNNEKSDTAEPATEPVVDLKKSEPSGQ
ncbi:MAG TPA: hypothetical protein VGK00_08845 [Anaerolineales bacterium]|jgi:hypothetical protein